jgi:two-component system chemotaxis sensor kinase CheA
MIKDGMLGDINREQESGLEKVIGQANDLLTMITSILYATSIETQELRTEPHRFALGDFLDELRTAYDVPRDKALTLTWNYPPDLPAVETDSEKLKYILHNLIHNAIKFTDRGQVTISATIRGGRGQAITDSDQQPANGKEEELIEFKVADTGIGISQEKLPLIFEKFHQIDSSDTRPYGGIGLGLYVAKNFTELLGGKIELETEQGKGSTFTVNIPCVIGSAATDGSQEKEQQVLNLQELTNPLPLGLARRSQEI